jgi:DNA-binding NarL/FixJ family response regulator
MANNLILASSCQDRLAFWRQEVSRFVNIISELDKFDALKNDVARIKPQALLLDFDLPGLNGANDVASLKGLSAETKIIILSGTISEDTEWELFKAGARGCCRYDIKSELLQQVFAAVQQGELWMRRTLTCRLIDEFAKATSKNKAYRPFLGQLDKLTQREYDIAVRVGKGENNKQIAQSCGITERTVKAHLTEVYLKLGITDRLNLALIISSDARRQRRCEFQVTGSNLEAHARAS